MDIPGGERYVRLWAKQRMRFICPLIIFNFCCYGIVGIVTLTNEIPNNRKITIALDTSLLFQLLTIQKPAFHFFQGMFESLECIPRISIYQPVGSS